MKHVKVVDPECSVFSNYIAMALACMIPIGDHMALLGDIKQIPMISS